MPPDILGLIIGVLFIGPTLYLIRHKAWDYVAWPMFLVTLPIYYMLFGVISTELSVVVQELIFGLPYFAIGLLVWRIRSQSSLIIIALAWLSHGIYDFYHDIFFVNPGVFRWYPAFCALVDVVVAAYLFASYKRLAAPAVAASGRTASKT